MRLKRKKRLLQKIRRAALAELDRRYIVDYGDDIFTCDHCEYAPKCPWVYDLYNTNGDCIEMK